MKKLGMLEYPDIVILYEEIWPALTICNRLLMTTLIELMEGVNIAYLTQFAAQMMN
jgi:hypothetical protein